MALITDKAYLLHSLRLAHLRTTNDPHSARIISISPTTLSSNAYVRGSGLADLDIWPEIASGLDSPPLEVDKLLEETDRPSETKQSEDDYSNRRRRWNGKGKESDFTGPVQPVKQGDSLRLEEKDPSVKLKYSQTIGRKSLFQPGMQVNARPGPPARGDSSVATSATVTPRAQKVLHNALTENDWETPRAGTPGARRDRIRSATTDVGPNGLVTRSELSSPTNSSVMRTPVARALTSRATPTQKTISRITRPRADSAPMVVISSPSANDRDLSSQQRNQEYDESHSQTPQARSRPPFISMKPRRITSMIAARNKDSAFSPAAISSVLETAYLGRPKNEGRFDTDSGEGEIPPPGADPHTLAMQAQYGSILEQAMMSQSFVTGITENSGMISSSGMGTSYGNGFEGIYEEDEEDEGEEGESQRDMRGVGDRQQAAKSMLMDIGLGPPVSIGSMGHFPGTDTRPNSEVGSAEHHAAERFSGESRRSTIFQPETENATTFEKRDVQHLKVASSQPKVSGLSKLLNRDESNGEGGSAPGNPFARYACVPPPTGSSVPTLSLSMYFPFSSEPFKPLKVVVRKEVTVEELIGWSLHQYLEEDRSPGLEEDHDTGSNATLDPEVWYTTSGWALRMVEDDGEVDEDFPALDRESQVNKFSFGGFAVVEASSAQIDQNLAKNPLKRSGSATPHLQTQSRLGANNMAAGTLSATGGSTVDSPFDSPGLGPPSRNALLNTPGANAYTGLSMSTASAAVGGVMVTLKIRVIVASDVQFSTSLKVPSEMYFADITENLIHRRHLNPADPSEWVLVLGDLSMVLPLDRTVESLMGSVDLALVRKGWAQKHGLAVGKANERLGGDPSTSIFKRRSDLPRPRLSAGRADLTSTYKKFIVQRKMPIGRHERILAIDGDYIHIMPTDNKAFFDSMKTSSFHVTSIVACKQSSRSPGNFKIVVWRDNAEKRYDFEADSVRQAAEIISAIRSLMKLYQSERANLIPPASSRPGYRSKFRRPGG